MALASKGSTLFGWFMKPLSLALLLSPALFAAAPFVAFVGHTYDRLRGCLGMAQGWRRFAAYLVVANVAANLYPIVLQRYNRARIYRILVSCPS
jgi:hypothetical protein